MIAGCFQGTLGPNSALLILWKSENVGSKSWILGKQVSSSVMNDPLICEKLGYML